MLDDGDGQPRRELLLTMLAGEGEDRRFALKLLVEYAFGRAPQHLDVTSNGNGLFMQGGELKAYGPEVRIHDI